MANKFKGEFSLPVQPLKEGDPPGSLNLVFDWEALEHLEDYMNLGILEVLVMLSRGFRLKLTRGLFWAGLQKKHSDIKRDEIDGLIERCGGAFDLFAKLGDGLTKAFPTKTEGTDPAPGPRAAAAEVAAVGTSDIASAAG